MRAAVIVAVAALAVAAGGSAARAGFPGANGALVVSSNRAENLQPEIYAVSLSGAPRRNVSRNPGADTRPALSPDGSSLAFLSTRAGRVGVSVAVSDGSNVRRVPLPKIVYGSAVAARVSWSPDGTRLLVSVEGASIQDGAYLVDAADLRVRHLGRHQQPAWSPDGRSFAAALEDRTLGVVDLDGKVLRRLTSVGNRPSWSPDGRRILFQADGLAVVDADGTGARRLAGRADDPSWSPDGARIAFGNGRDVVVVDVDSGRETRVATGAHPAWSPDGRSIAFARAGDVYVAAAEGGAEQRVLEEPAGTTIAEPPVWSRDGGTLYVVTQISRNDSELYVIAPDGSSPIALTDNAVDETAPAWSPDGRRIAFVRAAPGGTDLYVISADGTGESRISARAGSEQSPSWSPDGAEIAFEHRGGVWVARADGSRARRLTSGKAPAWSPDGRRIAFAADGEWLRTIAPDGSDRVRLVRAREERFHCSYDAEASTEDVRGAAHAPSWAPDGRRVAFVTTFSDLCRSEGVGDTQIDVVAVADPDRRLVLQSAFGRLAWSPDGKRMAFSSYAERPVDGLYVQAVAGKKGTLVAGTDSAQPDWQPRCTITGSDAGDALPGHVASDLVCGLRGNDRITGGAGSDRLFGHEGNDRIDARDGGFDVVGCGPGTDVVRADEADRVGVDCERVFREAR